MSQTTLGNSKQTKTTSSTPTATESRSVAAVSVNATNAQADDDAGKKKKPTKRKKVNHACLYCRRSHMTCDEGRPCQRWYGPQLSYYLLIHSCISIKREIGHLCHDERRTKPVDKAPATRHSPTVVPNTFTPGEPTFVTQGLDWTFPLIVPVYQGAPPVTSAWSMPLPQSNFLYQPETLGNEFSVLTYVGSVLFIQVCSLLVTGISWKRLMRILFLPRQSLSLLHSCHQLRSAQTELQPQRRHLLAQKIIVALHLLTMA